MHLSQRFGEGLLADARYISICLLAERGYFSTEYRNISPSCSVHTSSRPALFSLSLPPKWHCLPSPPSLGSKKKQLTAFPEIFQVPRRRRKETDTKNALVGERETAMPQKHPQARDRSQRLGSVKLVQTRQVSVLAAAGLVAGANLLAFLISLCLGTYSALLSPHFHGTRQRTEIATFALRLIKSVCSNVIFI